MKLDTDKGTAWLREIMHNILQPGPTATTAVQRIGQRARQGLAVVLSALMIMIPMGQSNAFAQSAPLPNAGQTAPADADDSQQAPQGQPLSADQLDQLVAPVALYPDALVAQVLAAATYPTQVVEADRWRQSQGNASAEQIAEGAETHNWDPSVKALTAFPTVLAQMDRNLQWTTDLGNAYYNQPQDTMDSVQAMRQKAQAAGQLRNTPQQVVTNEGGSIAIAPANPQVVYVPVYNPWAVYGSPYPIYPGYYYAPPPGIFFGGLAIGFGVGIGIGAFSHWGWGWNRWGVGWHERAIFVNHNTFITHSGTVINRGFGRPGGPPRGFTGRGSFAARGGVNRPGGNFNRPGMANRGAAGRGPVSNRAGANRAAGSFGRPANNVARPGAGRPAPNMGRPAGAANRASSGRPGGVSHASNAPSHPSGGGRPSGGGHPSGGSHPSNGGNHSSGGHEGHSGR
jgi:hypothetical protein